MPLEVYTDRLRTVEVPSSAAESARTRVARAFPSEVAPCPRSRPPCPPSCSFSSLDLSLPLSQEPVRALIARSARSTYAVPSRPLRPRSLDQPPPPTPKSPSPPAPNAVSPAEPGQECVAPADLSSPGPALTRLRAPVFCAGTAAWVLTGFSLSCSPRADHDLRITRSEGGYVDWVTFYAVRPLAPALWGRKLPASPQKPLTRAYGASSFSSLYPVTQEEKERLKVKHPDWTAGEIKKASSEAYQVRGWAGETGKRAARTLTFLALRCLAEAKGERARGQGEGEVSRGRRWRGVPAQPGMSTRGGDGGS